ncbi:MAG: twin-arginine translocase subunit TatC [Planctomycetota bacterium]
MPAAPHPENFSMSFGDHLEELRRRILLALVVPLPLALLLFFVSDPIIVRLYVPLDSVLEAFDLPRRLQALGPAEVLGIKIKLSLILAAVLSAPWIIWQLWKFVQPGLYGPEQRFVHFLMPGSAVLTLTGLALMYFVMLPLMLQVLVLFGASLSVGGAGDAQDPRVTEILSAEPTIALRLENPETPVIGDVWLRWPQMELFVAVEAPPPEVEPDQEGGNPPPVLSPGAVEVVHVRQWRDSMIAQEFRLTTYINFVLLLMLGIVLAFQMPLVILLMGWMGLVTASGLRAKRKFAIFICAAVAAMITPADALSMLMMLVPLVALFELSIVLLVFAPASAVAEGTVLKRFRPRRPR